MTSYTEKSLPLFISFTSNQIDFSLVSGSANLWASLKVHNYWI